MTERRETRQEQAALRRIATLVATGVEPDELFAVVAEEVGHVVDAPFVAVARYGHEDIATVCGTFPPDGSLFRIGSRVSLEGVSVLGRIREGGKPSRIDDYTGLPGEVAEAARASNIRSAVGVPIVVSGRVWGSIVAWSTERLPGDFEARLAEFTELLAAAIANTEAREALAQLADEQAALRRVATLIARSQASEQFLSIVAREVASSLNVPGVVVQRYEADETDVTVGIAFEPDLADAERFFGVGSRMSRDPGSLAAQVFETHHSARIDDLKALPGTVGDLARTAGLGSGCAGPIMVDRDLWGTMWVFSRAGTVLPVGTENRLHDFIELVATAIANYEARADLAASEAQARELANEQAALRRVATLVAENAGAEKLLGAVAEEVARVLAVPDVTIDRFDRDGSATTVLARYGLVPGAWPVGSRWPLDGPSLAATIWKTGGPARIDDYGHLSGSIAAALRDRPTVRTVGVPIVVGNRVWGMIGVGSAGDFTPEAVQKRLARFTELVATAIANSEASEQLAELADEQAALRRVATLVVEGASAPELFAAVAEEVASVFGASSVTIDSFDSDRHTTVVAAVNEPTFPVGSRWPLDGPSLAALVLETARPARVEDYSMLDSTSAAAIRAAGVTATVGAPIITDGGVWGVICLAVQGGVPPPPDAEARLERFTELVAAAISNAHSRETLAELAREQAALRRVATRIAEDVPPTSLFASVADEVAAVLGVPAVILGRYGPDQLCTVVGGSSNPQFPVGSQWPLDGPSAAKSVLDEARAVRIDDYSSLPGTIAAGLRSAGIRSTVGAPIVVDGSVWGCISALAAGPELLPADSEVRLEEFTRLVAAAISKAAARDSLTRLVDQQAALRRVATLVAEGAAPAELFTAVAVEAGQLFDFAAVTLNRYEEEAVVVVADPLDSGFPVGSRWPFDGDSLAVRVYETRQMARIDDYSEIESSAAERMRERRSRSAIGVPIFVEGDLWGLMCVGAAATELLPLDTADRIAGFVELLGTAIANGQARDALRLLADEQAALRRVATLVARDAPPGEVFDAVAMEVGKLLDTDITVVGRYDDDGAATAIGSWSASPGGVPVGTRSAIGGHNVLTLVAETEKPARVDGYDGASGEAAEIARRHGWRSSIAAPISVEGRLWGVMLVAAQRSDPFPAGAEERLSAFTGLVATAIANAESKSELAASRRRIVAAADEARRRIERDLHDGIQQRLIALTFRARALARRPQEELPGIAAELSDGLREVSDELREVSRGIHPTILTQAGLGPALRALARRSTVPVEVDVRMDERLPTQIEATAYYIASEALTNVAKHAHANVVHLNAAHDEGVVTLEVRDDGIGGVNAGRGSGILGLTDRVEALGGTISIDSPPRGGTTLSVRLPLTP